MVLFGESVQLGAIFFFDRRSLTVELLYVLQPLNTICYLEQLLSIDDHKHGTFPTHPGIDWLVAILQLQISGIDAQGAPIKRIL